MTALTDAGATDLILDARTRLLEALAREGEGGTDALARAAEFGDEVVLVVESLTPSLVARLPPRVRGIVAVDEEPEAGRARTSHAAILARGRDIPLALVPSHVALAIDEGEPLVLDTTVSPARVWVSPSESLIGDARARQAQHRSGGGADERVAADAAATVAERHAVKLLVNVGSLHDRVPAGAEGVGLLRTELLFAGRTTAPTEGDQVAALLAVARAARGKMVTARLWDAGADKPLPWLPASSPESRGVALLFEHPAVLRTQLAAFARAAERAPVRALIPMTRGPADVTAVRAGLPGHRVPVGAMIETPEAARDASAIAEVADFVCIGTNDLSALTLGASRADAAQALDLRVLRLLARVIESVHACGKEVTVCGEVAGDPLGAAILVGLGVDGLSVAPPRFPSTSRTLAEATVDQCEAAARRALGTERSHG
ncbi:MAG TPA: putative PEP-binding protein [Polyangiaceae bacterium]